MIETITQAISAIAIAGLIGLGSMISSNQTQIALNTQQNIIDKQVGQEFYKTDKQASVLLAELVAGQRALVGYIKELKDSENIVHKDIRIRLHSLERK